MPIGEALAVALGRLYAQQVGVVLAEGILGLELHLDRLARRLPSSARSSAANSSP